MSNQDQELFKSDDRAGNEPKDYKFVNAGDGMVAVKIDNPGDIFHLSSLPDEEFLGVDQFTDVYIKDKEGKRYWIRRDHKEGIVQMIDKTAEGSFHIVSIDSVAAERLNLVIGKPFSFGSNSIAEVKEIVALNKRPDPSIMMPTDEGLDKVTVINDFVTESAPSQS